MILINLIKISNILIAHKLIHFNKVRIFKLGHYQLGNMFYKQKLKIKGNILYLNL